MKIIKWYKYQFFNHNLTEKIYIFMHLKIEYHLESSLEFSIQGNIQSRNT